MRTIVLGKPKPHSSTRRAAASLPGAFGSDQRSARVPHRAGHEAQGVMLADDLSPAKTAVLLQVAPAASLRTRTALDGVDTR